MDPFLLQTTDVARLPVVSPRIFKLRLERLLKSIDAPSEESRNIVALVISPNNHKQLVLAHEFTA